MIKIVSHSKAGGDISNVIVLFPHALPKPAIPVPSPAAQAILALFR